MLYGKSCSRTILTLCLAASAPAVWAESSTGLSGHVETGMEYDSNLTVDNLNAASGKSDEAWLIGAGLDGEWNPVDRLHLNLGYSFTGNRYQTYDEFDQDIHLASAEASYDFDPFTLGASYHFSHATLDSDPFLDYARTSVFIGSLVSDDVYLRGSVQKKRKSFDDSEARDADIRGVTGEAYLFFNDARSHVLLGVDGDREDARSDYYDNRLVRFRSKLVHTVDVSGHSNRFSLGWRFEKRDYDDVVLTSSDPAAQDPLFNPFASPTTTTQTQDRAETASVFQAGWTVDLSSIFSLETQLSRGFYHAAVDSEDYRKTVASVTLKAGF